MIGFLKHADNFVGSDKSHFSDLYVSRVNPTTSGFGDTLLPTKKELICVVCLWLCKASEQHYDMFVDQTNSTRICNITLWIDDIMLPTCLAVLDQIKVVKLHSWIVNL